MKKARFLYAVLCCSDTGNHPQEELAKFGYLSERKVENFKNPTIFQQLFAETYCLNMASSEKTFSLGNFGTFFPQKFTLDIFFKFFLITKW